MGVTPVKKTPAKATRSPAKQRRSPSKAIKDGDSSVSPVASMASMAPIQTPNPARESPFSYNLPTQEQRRSNGRVRGRKLIMWGRPRMGDKLLLNLYYECIRRNVILPWDAVAHRLHPGSSGAAIVQHMNRLRKELVREGHVVPPVCQKPGSSSKIDNNIRGYIRKDLDGDDKDTTRPVYFDEKCDDPKLNLPDSFLPSDDEDEDYFMPDSPTPMRKKTPRVFNGLPGTPEESVANPRYRYQQSWSPQSSFCSPTQQQRADADVLDNPPMIGMFGTPTSAASGPTSAPCMPSGWQEAIWPQPSTVTHLTYAKEEPSPHDSIAGYLMLPATIPMIPTEDWMLYQAGYQQDSQEDFQESYREESGEDDGVHAYYSQFYDDVMPESAGGISIEEDADGEHEDIQDINGSAVPVMEGQGLDK